MPRIVASPADALLLYEAELRRRSQLAVPSVGSFADFVGRQNPTLMRFEHIPRLINVAQRVIDRELTRVLVIMPPRYFKSETFSRLMPAYNLLKHSHEKVGLASYGADLAWSLSEEARNYYQGDGGKLSGDTSAKKRWRVDVLAALKAGDAEANAQQLVRQQLTKSPGEMWAAGVGGPLLGFGYHLGIVDDPTDPEKAHSPTYQKRFREWWPGKFLSRQEPNARVVFVMQRLGLDDPVDFLFRREVGDNTEEAPEYWHVVLADEVKSDEPLGRWTGPMGLPETCTLEPDTRPKGTVLAPSRFSAAQVEKLQTTAGPLVTSAQRQGRPMRPSGDFWRLSWFEEYDELPAHAYNGGKDWDTAYTKEEANSATAFVESYRGPGNDGQFPIYIQDAGWDWYEFPEMVDWMRAKAGPHYVEEKASGKSAAQTLRTHHVHVQEVTVKGDKFARSSAVQPLVSTKRVYIQRALKQSLLYGERQGLLRVTAEQLLAGGPDLDLNDAFVQALTRHAGINASRFWIGK